MRMVSCERTTDATGAAGRSGMGMGSVGIQFLPGRRESSHRSTSARKKTWFLSQPPTQTTVHSSKNEPTVTANRRRRYFDSTAIAFMTDIGSSGKGGDASNKACRIRLLEGNGTISLSREILPSAYICVHLKTLACESRLRSERALTSHRSERALTLRDGLPGGETGGLR